MPSQSVTIGLIRDIFAQPLTYAIETNKISHPFVVQFASVAENAQKLAAGQLDVALVSPIDYARNSVHWEIIPGLGVASFGTTGAAKLLFKPNLNKISTIAADLRFPTELLIAQLVFLEKTGEKPQFIIRGVQSGIVPETTDAALFVGNDALPIKTLQEGVFDLAEEWNDLTGLPLVHAFFAARRGTLSPTTAALLMQSHAYFVHHKDDIVRGISKETGIESERLEIHLSEEIRYTLDELDLDGLRELFRHCFYHQMLDEIPDIFFSQAVSADQTRMN